METVFHKANSRGHANHGWLDTYHTFSFGHYYDSARMGFGALRVLNDDRVEAGKGFGTHPHDNMEIISIPLEGDLEHKDSMGNKAVIRQGDIQVMSAGTGVFHSEYNLNSDQAVKFLQIWIFPNKKDMEPRYDQRSIRDIEQANQFNQILSPHKDDQGVWIHQDAWFHIGNFEAGKSTSYSLNRSENGVYLFLLEGEGEVEGQLMEPRDGMGIQGLSEITFNSNKPSRILLMEVPMHH